MVSDSDPRLKAKRRARLSQTQKTALVGLILVVVIALGAYYSEMLWEIEHVRKAHAYISDKVRAAWRARRLRRRHWHAARAEHPGAWAPRVREGVTVPATAARVPRGAQHGARELGYLARPATPACRCAVASGGGGPRARAHAPASERRQGGGNRSLVEVPARARS